MVLINGGLPGHHAQSIYVLPSDRGDAPQFTLNWSSRIRQLKRAAQGTLGTCHTRQISLVQYQDVGDLEDAGLDSLHLITHDQALQPQWWYAPGERSRHHPALRRPSRSG